MPHIVLGLLAVFFAYDSQQNITLAASDLPYEDGEPHHITVPAHAGTYHETGLAAGSLPRPPGAAHGAGSAVLHRWRAVSNPLRHGGAGGDTV